MKWHDDMSTGDLRIKQIASKVGIYVNSEWQQQRKEDIHGDSRLT